MPNPLPVTILTGFLGSGKTTLLQHILNEQHGHKIAVIENEFGAESIDDSLLGEQASQITVLSNGCICCSSANELAQALNDLLTGIDQQQFTFDRLVIECTGMADPGPIIQTFFSQAVICERFLLDGIITLVDVVHAKQQLNKHPIAQAQIGYADQILLTKTDIQPNSASLIARLQKINGRAPIHTVKHGDIDLNLLFDLQGFILNDRLSVNPTLFRFAPTSQNQIHSLAIKLDYEVQLEAISQVMQSLLEKYADNLLRYKGIIAIKDAPQRLIFQGVQRLYSASWDRDWQADETRQSVMIFIGQNLPESEIRAQFQTLQPASATNH